MSYGHVVGDEKIASNGGLLEYSVVYTDRALNHMSEPFQEVMKDLNTSLTKAYNTDHCVILPGSGTYAMECAARAFGCPFEAGKKALVVRNGYFSFRWTQIFESLGKAEEDIIVMKAQPEKGWETAQTPVAPPPIDEVVAKIKAEKPVFIMAPHVETSAGIIIPDDYISAIAAAAKEVGAAFCLDGVASGSAWVDMSKLGIDCYVTAPQKGWSGPACCGVVMLSDRGLEMAKANKPSSFTIDVCKWKTVMQAYLDGGHMYHCTMPTDAIRTFRDVVKETEAFGLDNAKDACWKLGNGVRDVLKKNGFPSVAADGYGSPGVAVVYAPDATFAGKFKAAGLQIAAGVPLKIGEPADTFKTFRIGLFGLDKLQNVDLAIANFDKAVTKILSA